MVSNRTCVSFVMLMSHLVGCSVPHYRGKKTRIINGEPSQYGKYTFVVSIQVKGSLKCGGSVIGHYFVLTAAHCCVDKLGRPVDKKQISISAGNTNWKEGTMFDVGEIHIHPQYDKAQTMNDVAVLKSVSKLTSDKVSIVRLLPDKIDNNAHLIGIVFGWGYTNNDKYLVRKPSPHLNQVEIHTVLDINCKHHYKKFTDNNLCMSSPDMRGSCNGDSGGPLIIKRESVYYQIGIVSFGANCNNTKPEVYTRVSVYYNWIKSKASLD